MVYCCYITLWLFVSTKGANAMIVSSDSDRRQSKMILYKNKRFSTPLKPPKSFQNSVLAKKYFSWNGNSSQQCQAAFSRFQICSMYLLDIVKFYKFVYFNIAIRQQLSPNPKNLHRKLMKSAKWLPVVILKLKNILNSANFLVCLLARTMRRAPSWNRFKKFWLNRPEFGTLFK